MKRNNLFYLMMSLIFGLSLSYQIQLLIGIRESMILDILPLFTIFLVVFFVMSKFLKTTITILILIAIFLIANWYFELNLVDLSVLERFYLPLRWMVTYNDQKGVRPEWFIESFTFVMSLASFVFFNLFKATFLNLLLLTIPLFFVNVEWLDGLWLFMFLAGLFSISSLFSYSHLYSSVNKRPSLLMMGLVVCLVFAGSRFVSSETLFIPEFSRWINDFSLVPSAKPKSDFSLGQAGFSYSNTRIGGPVEMTNTPFMTVTGPYHSFYLRGTIFTDFNDNVWSLTSMNDARDFSNQSPSDDQIKTFDVNEKNRNRYNFSFMPLIIEPINRTFTTVFTGGTPIGIKRGKDYSGDFLSNEDFIYNEHGQITSRRLIDQEGVTSIDILLPTRNQTLNEVFSSQYEIRKDPTLMEAELLYESLVLQHDPILHNLIYKELVNSQNQLLTIQAIINHFANEYRYSIDVPDVPFEESVLEWFLVNRVGYCVYFGSLMTVLLQDIGIDARYVEGFVVQENDGPILSSELLYERTVTSNTAHAWTEIYLHGFGWLPVDTTSPQHLIQLDRGNPQEGIHDEENPISIDPSNDDSLDPTNSADEEIPTEVSSDWNLVSLMVVMALIIIIGW